MSNWTDNPFGAQDDNPFGDPSVQSASASVPEYNPFEVPPSSPTRTSASAPRAAPAPVSAPPPATITHEEVPSWAKPRPPSPPPAQKVEQKRAQEYQQREVEAQQTPEEYAKGGRAPNFPNFPQCMRVGFLKPCYHINIKAEIPLQGQRVLRLLFLAWEAYVIALLWNFISCLASLAGNASGKSVSCALSAAYLLAFVPCSFSCWFNPLYNALRTDSSMRFGWFFLVFGAQFVFCVLGAIGIPSTGLAGIWTAIQTVDDDTIASIIIFTSAGVWGVLSLLYLYLIKAILSVYRSQGGSVEKMQQEAIVTAASNKAVQKAAADAVISQIN